MRFQVPIAIFVLLVALTASAPTYAVIVVPSEQGGRYLSCVEALADRDTNFRIELLASVTRHWNSNGRKATRWPEAAKQSLISACGRAPSDPIEYDVVPYAKDRRPSHIIATDLVAQWSVRLYQRAGPTLRWLSHEQARALVEPIE